MTLVSTAAIMLKKYYGTVLFPFLNVTSVGWEPTLRATGSASKQQAPQAECSSYNKHICMYSTSNNTKQSTIKIRD
jgi:hypothetical protein